MSELETLGSSVGDASFVRDHGFQLLQGLASAAAQPELEEKCREVALRLVENRESLGSLTPPYESLLRNLGLYPFIDRTRVGAAENLAIEVHRPIGLDADIIFHQKQAEVYWELLDGRNVIL